MARSVSEHGRGLLKRASVGARPLPSSKPAQARTLPKAPAAPPQQQQQEDDDGPPDLEPTTGVPEGLVPAEEAALPPTDKLDQEMQDLLDDLMLTR